MTESHTPLRFEEAKSLFLQGLASFGSGRYEEAERRFLSSLDLLPGRVSTLVNLAATRLKLDRPQDALATTDQVLAIEPRNLEAWFHRGDALALLERHAEALGSYEQVLQLDDRAAEPWLRHGQTLQSLDRHAEALASYERALAIDSTLMLAWTHRGGILREQKRLDEAAESFRQAIAHGADAELNGYYLASVGGGAIPPSAPGRYVEPLFDDYAGEFEQHLVQVLHYRAHTVLVENLAGLAPGGGRYASALDLGCGTGLCGRLVKPMTARLTGVDLSAKMLEQARALGVYEQLIHAEIVEHLHAADERYDLVMAADVFIYVGDLAPVFDALHARLEPAGVFCFSAEIAEREDRDFALLPSLRYAHAPRYLRELASRHGFEIVRWRQEPIRNDQKQPVAGAFVYLARR